tara:strand:+ start:6681 stop:8150 length:1470 start_codon:yes stop_codon:yes gene_type:complete
MNEKKYRWLLYLIATTIVLTVAVQCYWNYKNYLVNKQNFTNQVQISLDNALDTYYADLAESNQMTLINVDPSSSSFKDELNKANLDSVFKSINHEHKTKSGKNIKGFTQLKGDNKGYTYLNSPENISEIKVIRGKKASDSIKLIKNITSIYISITNDSLDFEKLDPILKKELNRKQLAIPFALKHYKNDRIFNSFNTNIVTKKFLNTPSKSTFLKENEHIQLLYPNATTIILKRSFFSILISFILVLAVISCLFYLLKIIKKQKQLAEVKNDLISNITHEFKTPIATIGVALESIKSFNVIDDKEKTKSYLEMSGVQLTKLNVMVEKLLETATLDSENLNLNKENVDISDLLETMVNKHKLQTEDKTINLSLSENIVTAKVDIFHFENAINNILDNAIKYGGNLIEVNLSQNSFSFTVTISDNGNSLKKVNSEKIFEKFYRVPKGNTHDVKGFGIGLYYTKKIIEKHHGSVLLNLDITKTTFKTTLPNE